jgi:hypothetical protein
MYVKAADAIATPPAVIANRLFAPKEHSIHAFVAAALSSLLCSFLFYMIVSYGLIEAILRFRSCPRDEE